MEELTMLKILKNIPIKTILIVIVVLIIAGSFGHNIWTELEKMKASSYQQGLTDGASNIVQQIKNGIRVNFDEGVILFVPKQ